MTVKESGGRVNIAMTRGDSESITVACFEKDDGGRLTPLPFQTGDSVFLTLRQDAESDIALQKTVTVFTDGKAIIPIDSDDTAGLDFGDYIYDVQVTWADGTVKTVIPPSRFRLEEEVTW